jgi:hypothetical protein
MRKTVRTAAVVQLVLIAPAVLFLTAVFVGIGDPPQYELAHIARGIVAWYAGRVWTLWFLLLALPCAAAIAGGGTLLRAWHAGDDQPLAPRPSLAMIPAPLATLVVGATTLMSAAIMAVVVLHMLAN